jgi:hypothetical protein
MSLTVTCTQSDAVADELVLAVRVVTGAAGSPIGTIVQSTASGGLSASITPAASGSIIYGGLGVSLNNGAYPSTAVSGTTVISDSGDLPGATSPPRV